MNVKTSFVQYDGETHTYHVTRRFYVMPVKGSANYALIDNLGIVPDRIISGSTAADIACDVANDVHESFAS